MEGITIESGFCVVDGDDLRKIKGALPEEGERLMEILSKHEKDAPLIKKGEPIDSKIYKL